MCLLFTRGQEQTGRRGEMKHSHSYACHWEEPNIRSDILPVQQKAPVTAAFSSVTREMMMQLLDLSPDALLVANAQGKLVLVNMQVATLFGYDLGELVGQRLDILLPERLRATHKVHWEHYLVAPSPRPMGQGLTLVGRRKDGSEFPLDISLRPILMEQTLHIIGAIRDMTILHQVQQEREQQAAQLTLQARLIDLAHDAILVR